MTSTEAKPELSVSFHCGWPELATEGSFYVRALRRRFNVRIESVGRDLQIFSTFGAPKFATVPGCRPLRVWITGEAQEPRGAIFDLHFAFAPTSLLGDRWHRLPLWIAYLDFDAGPERANSVRRLLGPRPALARPKFCNFIYSSPMSLRAEFYFRLNARRPVDSLGTLMAGPGGRVADKLAALVEYRQTIAFENVHMPGYVTEKLVEPLLAGSIPIYWGADEARSDFNSEAFVFARDFGTIEALVDHVVKLDDSRDAWAEMAAAPAFPGNRLRPEHTPDYFADRIADALGSRLSAPVCTLDQERFVLSAQACSGSPAPTAVWHRLGRLLRCVRHRTRS